MAVDKIESTEHFQTILKSNERVVAEFSATWYRLLTRCGPCRMISPKVKQLSDQFPQLKFVEIDVDDCQVD
jgi:thioredoxin 1